MVLDNIWEVWPFKGYFNTRNPRRHAKQTSRCSTTSKGQNEPLINILGPWESNMVALQSILIWEKPGKSVVAVIAANIVYWSLAYSEVRFFFGLSVLGIAAFLHHQWVYTIWPEISVPQSQLDQEDWTPVHPSVLSAPEVSRYLKNMWKYFQQQQTRMTQLRRKQPGLFCFIMVTALCLLWLLGYFVSGVILLYTLLMCVMCGPGFVIHIVPKSIFKKIEQISSLLFDQRSDSSQNSENDLAEFLPEESSAEVQTALGIPLSTAEPSDESPGASKGRPKGRGASKGRRGKGRKEPPPAAAGVSFSSGLSDNDFPSVEESLDFVEEADLALPEIIPEGKEVAPAAAPGEEGMTFVSSHFGDSSEDEDDFAAGLSFRRTATPALEDSQAPPVRGDLPPQILPIPASATNVVINHLMGSITTESTTTLLSSIGQHLASAIGATAAPATQQPLETSLPPVHEGEPKMSISGSSLEEEFELISDDDLH